MPNASKKEKQERQIKKGRREGEEIRESNRKKLLLSRESKTQVKGYIQSSPLRKGNLKEDRYTRNGVRGGWGEWTFLRLGNY